MWINVIHAAFDIVQSGVELTGGLSLGGVKEQTTIKNKLLLRLCACLPEKVRVESAALKK